jgi:hypothetical protein
MFSTICAAGGESDAVENLAHRPLARPARRAGLRQVGAITRHSASVRSVWYRVTGRLCCSRMVGVHMANPRLVHEALESPIGTTGYWHLHSIMVEMVRHSPAAAAPHVDALVELGQAHKMPTFQVFGSFLQPWSRAWAGDAASRLTAMRNGIATIRANGIGLHMPVIATALAEAEAQAGELEVALATVDGVIADSERSGQRWFTAETQRIRGKILLKRDPAHVASAEEAFLTAIAIAQQQRARSFELRAAASMARSGAIRASAMKPASSSLRSTAGLLKGSTRAI